MGEEERRGIERENKKGRRLREIKSDGKKRREKQSSSSEVSPLHDPWVL